MRICHVIEAAGGGSGQVVLDLARFCRESGDDVTVVYAPARASPRFLKQLESLKGVAKLPVPMQRKVGGRDVIDGFRLGHALTRAGPFDVIHSHSSKAGALVRLAGLFFPRTVQVYTPHAFVTMAPRVSPVYGWIERVLGWLSDAVVVVSAREEDHARLAIGITKHKIHKILNGIQLETSATRFDVRRKLGIAEHSFLIGFAGRLVPQKNPERLVESFTFIAKQIPEAQLIVVGSGPLLETTQEAFRLRGLATRTQFLTNHDARDVLPAFDCLLMTSDYEGFPLVFLEALAAGVPVVTTPVGGAEEVVGPDEAGIVTSDFRPESLAAAVQELAAQNTEAREHLRCRVLRRSKEFGLAVMGEKTRALYAALLKQRRAYEGTP